MTVAVLSQDEPILTKLVPRLNRLLCGEGDVLAFTSEEALAAALKNRRIDMVFVQADAEGANWAGLQKWLSFTQPWAKLVLMADSDAYAIEAIRAHVHDYLVTPISDERLMGALREVEAYEKPAQ